MINKKKENEATEFKKFYDRYLDKKNHEKYSH